MPERREEDMGKLIPVPTKPFIPAIPTNDDNLRELREDLRAMGCAGLLARPWNVQSDDVLRGAINSKELRGENRNVGLRIRGLRFTGFREVLREDGQDVRMDCLPKVQREG